jgi:hypothetical protein
MLFAKPLHLTVEEAQLSEVNYPLGTLDTCLGDLELSGPLRPAPAKKENFNNFNHFLKQAK